MAENQAFEAGTSYNDALAAQQGSSDERAARLRALQMHDLGTARRDFISMHDVPDGIFASLSTSDLERQRRSNQESVRSNRERQQIAGWNTAHLRLINDDTYEEGLEDLNAGQSHRARLLAEISQQPAGTTTAARDAASQGRGSVRSRGSGRGGRGGAAVASGPNRFERRRTLATGSLDLTPRVRLPSILGQPRISRPEPARATVRLPNISTHASSPVTNSGRSLRTQVGNLNLALPSEFMAHGFATNRRTTFGSQAASSSQATSAQTSAPQGDVQIAHITPTAEMAIAASYPVSQPSPSSQAVQAPSSLPPQVSTNTSVPARVVPQPPMGTLLDADSPPTNAFGASASNPYADDLLGLEFNETTELPAPMQLTTQTDWGSARTAAAAAVEPTLQQLNSTLTSYLSIIKSNSPPTTNPTIQSIEAAIREVQQKISNLTLEDHPSQQVGVPLQNLTISSERVDTQQQTVKPVHQELSRPAGSLAQVVQQNTTTWSRQVIGGTVPNTTSILGEYVYRTRFHRRHDSATSINSLASVSDVEALAEPMVDPYAVGTRPRDVSQETGTGEHLTQSAFVSAVS
ncbi:MAG: hypothetical protein Q9181_002444 [Wetmoreana brouardii]